MPTKTRDRELVVLTGMSGSGKSVALHALEDLGFYCVDNLPPALLQPLLALLHQRATLRVAVAMDIRTSDSSLAILASLEAISAQDLYCRTVFLDADDAVLSRRYAESRRAHPLSISPNQPQGRALADSIAMERVLLAPLRERSLVLDTGFTTAAQLLAVLQAALALPQHHLTLVIQSFGFKRGLPLDSDYVFDVRMLPNPYQNPQLRPLTGQDGPVQAFLQAQPVVEELEIEVTGFLVRWLPRLATPPRSYVTVSIGCTGGQHRSVYLAERVAQQLQAHWSCLLRHRDLGLANAKPRHVSAI